MRGGSFGEPIFLEILFVLNLKDFNHFRGEESDLLNSEQASNAVLPTKVK